MHYNVSHLPSGLPDSIYELCQSPRFLYIRDRSRCEHIRSECRVGWLYRMLLELSRALFEGSSSFQGCTTFLETKDSSPMHNSRYNIDQLASSNATDLLNSTQGPRVYMVLTPAFSRTTFCNLSTWPFQRSILRSGMRPNLSTTAFLATF